MDAFGFEAGQAVETDPWNYLWFLGSAIGRGHENFYPDLGMWKTDPKPFVLIIINGTHGTLGTPFP